MNCTAENFAPQGLSWKVVFPSVVWMIWENRNQVQFKNKSSNPNLSKLILQRVREFYHCAYNPKEAVTRVVKAIRWEKPTRRWVKLNTNGSS